MYLLSAAHAVGTCQLGIEFFYPFESNFNWHGKYCTNNLTATLAKQ